MNKLDIVIAPLSDKEYWENESYACVNVVGIFEGPSRAVIEATDRILGVNAWRFKDPLKGQDYLAATLGYRDLIYKKPERVFKNFLNWFRSKGNPSKIAFLGLTQEPNGYCYRYLFLNFFREHLGMYMPKYRIIDVGVKGISQTEFNNIAYDSNYWQQTKITFDKEHVGNLLESTSWTFAKTMPENPHEYTLRKNWSSVEDYLQVSAYIRSYGKLEEFYGQYYRVLYLGGHKYWTHPVDVTNKDVDLINRTGI